MSNFLDLPYTKKVISIGKAKLKILTALLLVIALGCSGCSAGRTVEAPAPESPSETPVNSGGETEIIASAPDISGQDGHAPSEAGGKTELTLATISDPFFNGLSALTSGFNAGSEDYNIVIKDYSEGGQYDAETARIRLNAEIGSGKCPDLLFFSDGLSPYTFVKHGYLADLLTYIDSDPEITRDSISVLDPLLINGGLYYLSQGFTLETGTAKYSDFGDRYGWTLDEYFEIESSLPSGEEMIYNATAESFIESISSRYIRTAVDWDSGTCDFNNDTFIAILEAGKRIKENPEPNDPSMQDFTYGPVRVAKGTLAMAMSYCNTVGKLAFEELMAGEKLSFIGWPSVDGSCGSDIYPYKTFAAFSASEHKDGCWEFLKFMMLDYLIDNDNGFMPMYRPMLDLQIDEAKAEAPRGGAKMDDEDVERFLDLLGHVENAAFYDQTILGIIAEEAAAYLAGDCSAEKAAENVQSRVSLYIGEQS